MKPALLAFLVLLLTQALGSRPFAALPDVTWTQWVYCYSLGVGCQELRERLDAVVLYTPPGPNAYIARPVDWPFDGGPDLAGSFIWTESDQAGDIKQAFRMLEQRDPEGWDWFQTLDSLGVSIRIPDRDSAWWQGLGYWYRVSGAFVLGDGTDVMYLNSRLEGATLLSVIEHEAVHLVTGAGVLEGRYGIEEPLSGGYEGELYACEAQYRVAQRFQDLGAIWFAEHCARVNWANLGSGQAAFLATWGDWMTVRPWEE